jgi:hypothetical protein
MKKFTKPIATICFVLFVFLGVSLNFHRKEFKKEQDLQDALSNIRIDLSGVKELSAGTAESWGFVRQSATWARANSIVLDGLIGGLQKSGIFNRISSGELIVPNQTSNTGQVFTYRLKINENVSGITSTAYSGSKTFSHRFEMWKSGDTIPTLQLFFSSLTGTGTTGVLLYYNLSKLNPTSFGTATNAVTESYISGNKGDMKQTYSWKNGPQDSKWLSKNGRVIVREMKSGAEICVRSVVTMNTGSAPFAGKLDTVCGANTNIYYLLNYVQKTAPPFQTVAKAGLAKTTPIKNISTFCGHIGNNFPNLPGNYGLFIETGFVGDGFTSANIPAGYPSAKDVDDAFSRTGAGLLDTGTDGLGIQEFDRSDATFMDGLSTNTDLDFKGPIVPPSCSQSFCIQ